MDETTKAVLDAARGWRARAEASLGGEDAGAHEARMDLWAALDAHDRAHPAVPTEPGAYYLEDGRAAVVAHQGGALWAKMYKPDGYRKDSWVDNMAERWSTDPTTGEVERVPGLEEWRALVAERDGWAKQAEALLIERSELLDRVESLEAHGETMSLHKLRQQVAELEAERDGARATVERVREVVAGWLALPGPWGVHSCAREMRKALDPPTPQPDARDLFPFTGPHDQCVVEGAHRREDCRSVPTPQPQRCVDCAHFVPPDGEPAGTCGVERETFEWHSAGTPPTARRKLSSPAPRSGGGRWSVGSPTEPAPRCGLCRHWHLHQPAQRWPTVRGCAVYSARPDIADDVNTWWWEHSPPNGFEAHEVPCPGFDRRPEGER